MTTLSVPRAALICLALGSALTGCAPAAIQGVFQDEAFVLADGSRMAKASGTAELMTVVVAEREGDILRTVVVSLPAGAALPLHEPLVVGVDDAWDETRPSVSVVEGQLEVFTRPDGKEIWNTRDGARAGSVRGTLTLESRGAAAGDTWAGTFDVDLSDGGWLEGRFEGAL